MAERPQEAKPAETLEDLSPEEREIVLAVLKAYPNQAPEQAIRDCRLMGM
jgi:hypothetical protein